jgi:hypothetical protein
MLFCTSIITNHRIKESKTTIFLAKNVFMTLHIFIDQAANLIGAYFGV